MHVRVASGAGPCLCLPCVTAPRTAHPRHSSAFDARFSENPAAANDLVVSVGIFLSSLFSAGSVSVAAASSSGSSSTTLRAVR